MENPRRQAPAQEARRLRAGTRCALACIVAGALAGCAQNNRAATNADPLFGSPGRPPTGSAAGWVTPPGPSAAIAPPPPPLTAPASTAALASGPARPLDNSMRIGADPVHPADHPNGGNWGAVLPGPEPATGSLTHSAPPNAPFSPASAVHPAPPPAAGGASYEDAQAILHSKGVLWQRLETWGDKGEWKFSCSIPNRQNPAISRTYEARAANSLDAIHAVIEKLDKD